MVVALTDAPSDIGNRTTAGPTLGHVNPTLCSAGSLVHHTDTTFDNAGRTLDLLMLPLGTSALQSVTKPAYLNLNGPMPVQLHAGAKSDFIASFVLPLWL